jgi:hypothetical protein
MSQWLPQLTLATPLLAVGLAVIPHRREKQCQAIGWILFA